MPIYVDHQPSRHEATGHLAEIAMQAQSLNNRLHRSGAIDFNVEFNTRQAQMQNSSHCNAPRVGKKLHMSQCKDDFSVCEGEPLFHVKQSTGNKSGGIQANRRPISLQSSLNGYVVVDQDTLNKCMTGGKCMTGVCDTIRDAFFKNVVISGVAVSKWDFNKVGRQADQFVATSGGLNTLYVDEDVAAGDLVIADIPFDAEMGAAQMGCTLPGSVEFGFVSWQQKKGVPKSKRTLVLRPMPRAHAEGDDILISKFHRRGQVIGVCVRGAKKGERADIVHCHNAVGLNTKRKRGH